MAKVLLAPSPTSFRSFLPLFLPSYLGWVGSGGFRYQTAAEGEFLGLIGKAFLHRQLELYEEVSRKRKGVASSYVQGYSTQVDETRRLLDQV